MTSRRRWPLAVTAAGVVLTIASIVHLRPQSLADRFRTVAAVPSASAAPALRTADPATPPGRVTPPGGTAVIRGLHPAPLTERPAAAPVRLVVPRLGLDTSLIRLGLDRSGALQVPVSPYAVGWYADGPAPGSVGPAVLAGHVDSKRGPGVFYRLREMRPGDAITVRAADGRSFHFTVTSVARYPKSAFPTADVYGPTPFPELRLVTCGGTFDWVRHHYRDNVVAYARGSAN